MECPVCHTALVMSERQAIEIDYCPSCRGVWLDRGELDKIIERAVPAQLSQPNPGQPASVSWQGQPRVDEPRGYRPQKRKKSFLEELFD
ncbi:zf-TFIIB domain-containing protein [Novosphingobium sp. G106]|uniref:TFIIB-type zinc ribbon-containing protein n=1 Tax=Novosphingobium sp. G106 TaxID=2849500 RepID=UPI001C2D7E0B|nr:zf-TFIIB domain-containing protein [Novosphingobium sp. G106]MBV1688415.1 zf-TFIIB domain-containing protein [Novosphingobium sp. G106]